MSKQLRLYRQFIITLIGLLLLSFHSVSAQPIVKITSPKPVPQEIYVGLPQAIHLIAQLNETGLQSMWSINAKAYGKLAGEPTSSAVFYIPPPVIDQESLKAVITVKVIDNEGKEKSDNITFMLFPPDIENLGIDQLFKIVDSCIENNALTTPEVMNAYDIGRQIWKKVRNNSQKKELLQEKFYAMSERYKTLTDQKYKELNTNKSQVVCQKTIQYYQGYYTVIKYLYRTIKDSSVKSKYFEVDKRLKEVKTQCEGVK